MGKSTSTSALVTAYRARGKRVGVLAVDPSSPFSGGALLGDRVRMGEHATDPGVFIRSMATRGHLGGLSWATPQALRVLDAAGCDVVLVETVGVGQSEVEVVSLADTTVVLLAPGMGDGVQAAKAGILEIADVFVVNKADRDGADQTARDLKHMISLGRRDREGGRWRPPVVKTVASRAAGLDEVVDAIDATLSALLRSRPVAGLDGRGRPWWWKPNVAGLVQMVEAAGFEVIGDPVRIRFPLGETQPRPPLRPSILASRAGREQIVLGRAGDPHAAVRARPRG